MPKLTWDPSIVDIAALLRCLQVHPLDSWGMRTDALPLRFRRVEQAAAKLLEPKMQVVRLGSATLKSAQDVRDWVARTEKTLLERLAEGPIILE